ncbi:MAG: hypothetical protein AAB368_17010, partial [bacterium]
MIPPARGALLGRLLLLSLVFSLPLAVLPGANDYVMRPKMAAALIGAIAVAGFALARGNAVWPAGHPASLPAACWLLGSAVAAAGAVNRWQAARLAWQAAGWLALFGAAAAVRVESGRMIGVVALSVAVQFAVAVAQLSGRWIVGHGELFGPGRIYATHGNPSFFGPYLAPVAVLLLAGLLFNLARLRRAADLWPAPVLF